MRDEKEAPMDYLASVEASHLATQAGPGVIYVHLRRVLESEQAEGRPARRMFIELELGQAVRHWRDLGELIRQATAMEHAR